jgi:hypothetical protein
MEPSQFFLVVIPLAAIIAVLVIVVYYLSKKTEKTNLEKDMKELSNSYFKGKIDKKTFLYIRDNLKAENHFSEESQKMNNMYENKKMDTETYLRMKKFLEMSFDKRLAKIHEKHNPSEKRSSEDFETYLKAMLKQDYPKTKYKNPDAW